MKSKFYFHNIIWIILVSLLPVFVVFMLAGMGIYVSGWLFIGLMVICFVFLYYIVNDISTCESIYEPDIETSEPTEMEVKQPFLESFQARRAFEINKNIFYEGKLLEKADIACQKLKQRFSDSGYTPMLQQSERGGTTLALISQPIRPAIARVCKVKG